MNISPLFICLLFAIFGAIIATGGGGHGGEVQTDTTVVKDSLKEPTQIDLAHGEYLPLRRKGQTGKKLCLVTPAEQEDGVAKARLIDYDAALLSKQFNIMIQQKMDEEKGEEALKNANCKKLAKEEKTGVQEELLVMNVDGETLAKVITWCEDHVDIFYEEEVKAKVKAVEKGKNVAEQIPPIPAYAVEKESKTEQIPDWFTELLKSDKQKFYELVKAANYLEVPPMIEMLSSTIVKDIMWRPADEIRKLYNIADDPKQAEAAADEKDIWRFEL